MLPFDQLYWELYTAINEALECIGEGASAEAVEKLVAAQTSTIEQILTRL